MKSVEISYCLYTGTFFKKKSKLGSSLFRKKCLCINFRLEKPSKKEANLSNFSPKIPSSCIYLFDWKLL